MNKTKKIANFNPAVWSAHIMDQWKKEMTYKLGLPNRSAGTQLLRDAALGHKEYPDDENE